MLVFTRTKHGADKVVRGLTKAGIAAEAIHGNKSQNQRERVLAAFRDGRLRTLVATDIAARGIDVDGVSHVVNYDLPNIPESYVHRIGRTARAGAEGIAISFCDPRGAGLPARHRAADPHDHPGNRPAHRQAGGPCGPATGSRPAMAADRIAATQQRGHRAGTAAVMAVPATTATGPITAAIAAKTAEPERPPRAPAGRCGRGAKRHRKCYIPEAPE